jgi:hypothetical protein
MATLPVKEAGDSAFMVRAAPLVKDLGRTPGLIGVRTPARSVAHHRRYIRGVTR